MIYSKKKKNEDWASLINATCPQCRTHNSMQQKCSVEDTSNAFILQVNPFSNNQQKITPFKVKQLPHSILKVKNISYKLYAAVFHHGSSITGGHYTAMVREGNKWLQLNMTRVLVKQMAQQPASATKC